MNFKTLTIAAAIVSHDQPGRCCSGFAQTAAAPAPRLPLPLRLLPAPDAAAPACCAGRRRLPLRLAMPPSPPAAAVRRCVHALWSQPHLGDRLIWFRTVILIVLAVMSVGTWYIFFTKYIDQQRILGQAKHGREEVLDLRHAE